MKISLGADHAGFGLKQKIVTALNQHYELLDRGTDSDVSCDYPDYAHAVAKDVESGQCQFGILVCGSGQGVCMAANKHPKIRAALCWSPEVAITSRTHNDGNIVCLPARLIEEATALEIVHIFLTTEFEGGRHANRVEKI